MNVDTDYIFLEIVFLVIILIGFLGYQCYNKIPINGKNIVINQDLIFWLRNTVAATKSFPLKELSTQGINIYYHYFSSFYLAYIHFITGIELADLCLGYSYLINTTLLLGSVYCLCNLLLKNRFYRYISVLIILLTEGFQKFVIVYYLDHLYIGSFGCAEGFALSLYSLYFFIRLLREKEKYWINFVFAILVFAVSLGTKAPCACVVLSSIGIGCLFLLFNKESCIRGLITGIIYLVVFSAVYLFFIRGINHEIGVSTQTMGFSLGETVLAGPFESGYRLLLKVFKLKLIAYVGCFVVWTVLSHPFLMFLLFVSFIVTRKAKYSLEHIMLAVAFVIAFLLTVFFYQTGHSQMYFYFSFIPFATLFVFIRFESTEYNLIKHKAVCICSCLLFNICLLNSFVYIERFCFGGLRTLIFGNENCSVTGLSVSSNEVEALRWLRDNSTDDSILITNKVFGENGTRSFITSAFSERQCYIEGSDYTAFPPSVSKDERIETVKRAFNGESEAINELIEKGVNYMVIYKKLPYTLLGKVSLNIMYENSDICIIKL